MAPNNKQWLPTGEALLMAEEAGIKMSHTGLNYQGLKYGFSRRAKDGLHWEYNRKKYTAYLQEHTKEPEDGYITLKEASQQFNIPISTLYLLVEKQNIQTKTFSREYVKYVRRTDLEPFVKNN